MAVSQAVASLKFQGAQQKNFLLFHPIVDLLILGGLTYFLFFGLSAIGYKERSSFIINLAAFLSIFVNYPHYAATYYRVYRSIDEIQKYSFVSLVMPFFLLLLVAACFLSPSFVAPVFCKAFLLTSGYHYSGQTYGIFLIFANKAGFGLNRLQKTCIGLPVYFSWLWPILRADAVGSQPGGFYGVVLPLLNLPIWLVDTTKHVFFLGLGLYILLSLYFWFFEKRLLPMVVHVVALSQIVWFTFGSSNPAFNEFVPFFHCIQYLLITCYFHFKEILKQTPTYSQEPLGYFSTWYFGKYYFILIIVGSILFYLIPYSISWAGVSSLFFANAVIISFINLHHFILDGEIWKLRKPEIRKVLIN